MPASRASSIFSPDSGAPVGASDRQCRRGTLAGALGVEARPEPEDGKRLLVRLEL